MNKVVRSLPSGKGKGNEKHFEWIPFRENERDKESSHERNTQKESAIERNRGRGKKKVGET